MSQYTKYGFGALLGLGGFLVWYYLYNINRLDLFYLVINSPINLLLVIIMFIAFFLLICLMFFMPSIVYLSFFKANVSKVDNRHFEKAYVYFLLLGLIQVVFICIYLSYQNDIFMLLGLLLPSVVFAMKYYCKFKPQNERLKFFMIILFMMLSINFSFLFTLYIYIIDAARANEEVNFHNISIIFFFMSVLLFASLMPALVFDYQKFDSSKIQREKMIISLFIICSVGIMIFFLLGKWREINFKALSALGVVQTDIRQYKINREHYLSAMFNQNVWGEGFKIDEKYIYVNAIRLFRLNSTNLICPPLIENYLDEVKGTDNGIRGGMPGSPNQIRKYTHLCLVMDDSDISLWPYQTDFAKTETLKSN